MNDNILKDLEYLKRNLENAEVHKYIEDTKIPNGIGIKYTIKRFIRKMTYWFIRPYWEQQIEYNKSIKAAVEDLYRIQCELAGTKATNLRGQEEQIRENLLKLSETKKKRVFQIVSSLNFGDAVGNDVIAIQNYLKKNNIVTAIFTNSIHSKIEFGTAFLIDKLPKLREDDIIVYHFASEDPLCEMIKQASCKVVLRYHNVTPPKFFHGFDFAAEMNTKKGLEQIRELAPYIDYGIVVSEFNKQDLINMGYTCPIEVAPILIQFDDYKKKPSQSVIDKYSDGRHNIIFVGRMAPNKKVEDVISAFATYKMTYDKDARLFLVGNYNEEDKYYKFLRKHISKLQVEDVFFSGHIPFDEILAYYTIADVFICMSEHEGFCVPLVEAMFFEVPIVAYLQCAVPDTLGGTGVGIENKDFEIIAMKMNELLQDEVYRNRIIQAQKKRLTDFDNEKVGKMIVDEVKNFMRQ